MSGGTFVEAHIWSSRVHYRICDLTFSIFGLAFTVSVGIQDCFNPILMNIHATIWPHRSGG